MKNDICRYQLDTAALAQAPEGERKLFLVACQLGNEIALLQKLVLMAFPGGHRDEPLLQAELTQAGILLRLLAGKLHEAWEMLRGEYFGPAISRDYEPNLLPAGKEALDELKRYHSNSNRIAAIRHSYAFHANGAAIDQGLAHATDEPLYLFLAESTGNSLHYATEVLLNLALLDSATHEELQSRHAAMLREVVDQARRWQIVLQHLAGHFLGKHPATIEARPTVVQLDGLPHLDDVVIPWFVKTGPRDESDS